MAYAKTVGGTQDQIQEYIRRAEIAWKNEEYDHARNIVYSIGWMLEKIKPTEAVKKAYKNLVHAMETEAKAREAYGKKKVRK